MVEEGVIGEEDGWSKFGADFGFFLAKIQKLWKFILKERIFNWFEEIRNEECR